MAFVEDPAPNDPPKSGGAKASLRRKLDVPNEYSNFEGASNGAKIAQAETEKATQLVNLEPAQNIRGDPSASLRHNHKPVSLSRRASSGEVPRRRPHNATFFEGESQSPYSHLSFFCRTGADDSMPQFLSKRTPLRLLQRLATFRRRGHAAGFSLPQRSTRFACFATPAGRLSPSIAFHCPPRRLPKHSRASKSSAEVKSLRDQRRILTEMPSWMLSTSGMRA